MDLLYALYATSYDITLVDTFCMFTWFMTGRVLVRFLQVGQRNNDEENVMTLRTELEFLRVALSKVGERFPLAFRYSKMLDDVVTRSCGTDILRITPFSSSAVSFQLLKENIPTNSTSTSPSDGHGSLSGLSPDFNQMPSLQQQQSLPQAQTQHGFPPDQYNILNPTNEPLDPHSDPFQASADNFDSLWHDGSLNGAFNMNGSNSASMLDLLSTFGS